MDIESLRIILGVGLVILILVIGFVGFYLVLVLRSFLRIVERIDEFTDATKSLILVPLLTMRDYLSKLTTIKNIINSIKQKINEKEE